MKNSWCELHPSLEGVVVLRVHGVLSSLTFPSQVFTTMPSSVAESRSAGEASTSEQVRLFKSSLLGRRFPGMRELPDEQIAAILKHDTKASKRALEVKTHPKSDFAPATLPPAEPARIFYPVNPTQARDTAKRQDSEVSVRQPAMQNSMGVGCFGHGVAVTRVQQRLGLACRARLSLLQGHMQPNRDVLAAVGQTSNMLLPTLLPMLLPMLHSALSTLARRTMQTIRILCKTRHQTRRSAGLASLYPHPLAR